MTGIELIAQERARQVEKEGWTPEHDDEYYKGSLAAAGACYALVAHLDAPDKRRIAKALRDGTQSGFRAVINEIWPDDWDETWFKPKAALRDLARAGALIAAEIDKLQRAEAADGE